MLCNSTWVSHKLGKKIFSSHTYMHSWSFIGNPTYFLISSLVEFSSWAFVNFHLYFPSCAFLKNTQALMTDESNLRVLNTISLFCITLLTFKSSWLTFFDRFQNFLDQGIIWKIFCNLRCFQKPTNRKYTHSKLLLKTQHFHFNILWEEVLG